MRVQGMPGKAFSGGAARSPGMRAPGHAVRAWVA